MDRIIELEIWMFDGQITSIGEIFDKIEELKEHPVSSAVVIELLGEDEASIRIECGKGSQDEEKLQFIADSVAEMLSSGDPDNVSEH